MTTTDRALIEHALNAMEAQASHFDPPSRDVAEQAIGLAKDLLRCDDPAGMLRVVRIWVRDHQDALAEDWRAVFSERF